MRTFNDIGIENEKKQQMLQLLSEHLLLHCELPTVSEVCARLSITSQEYARLLLLCSQKELTMVFMVLTPMVVLNLFQKTLDTVSAQKLWCELFFDEKPNTNLTNTSPITVHFVDEPTKESSHSALESIIQFPQNNK